MIRLPALVFVGLLFAPLGCGLNPQPEPPAVPLPDIAGGAAGGENTGGAQGDPTAGLADAGSSEGPMAAPEFDGSDGGVRTNAGADAGADAAP